MRAIGIPLKTIDDFIKYAKAHPGLSYGSAGIYGRGHLAIELFAQCKGLTFKHVPFRAEPHPVPLFWVSIQIF